MNDLINPSHDDAALDAVVAHLRTMNRHAFLAYVIGIGDFLVKRFFGGDFAAIHDQDPGKQQSFEDLLTRRTQDLKELSLSGTTLRRYMAATEVWHELPAHARGRLGVEVMHRLASVPAGPNRHRLAHDAIEMQWTRDQTTAAVRDFKISQLQGKKRGRKEKPRLLKMLLALHRDARKLVALKHTLGHLSEDHQLAYLAELDAVVGMVERLRV